MTLLEAKISELLSLCEAILEPVHITAEKWQIVSKERTEVRLFEDKTSSLSSSWAKAKQKIRELPSYDLAKKAFDTDEVFADGRRTAGHWATLDGVLYYLFLSSASLKAKGILIDHTKALHSLRSFRQLLASSTLTYKVSARLFGVNLRCKSLSLPDGITLYRLNRREKNERQPLKDSFFLSGWENEMFTEHPVEIGTSVIVPVDHTRKSAFFENKNRALQDANKIFSNILQAIFLAFAGRAYIAPVAIRGGIEQIPASVRILTHNPYIGLDIMVGRTDIPRIRTAYDLIVKEGKNDKTLGRALHRFILGRQRDDLVDKFIDYVIAWESILLTQCGDSIKQEMSYRFALNGVSVISAATKNPDLYDLFKKVRCAYSTRSAIVHGGDDKRVEKELKKGGFANLGRVCEFLEDNFRAVVFWLASLTTDIRPYKTQSGWESLIWDKRQLR